MQPSTILSHRSPALSTQRRRAEQAARQAKAAANWDDRVSENIFDVDDERAEVEIIARGIHSDAY